jgi:positive regulator of sigma E activity
MQSKKSSFNEILISTFMGLLVALASQLLIFPLYSIDITLGENVQITLFMTFVSILRGYLVRRYFNRKLTQTMKNGKIATV